MVCEGLKLVNLAVNASGEFQFVDVEGSTVINYPASKSGKNANVRLRTPIIIHYISIPGPLTATPGIKLQDVIK